MHSDSAGSTISRQPPTQTQLLLPVLESLQSEGGGSTPKRVYDVLRRLLGERADCGFATDRNGQCHDVFERQVRWTRQNAVKAGLIAPDAGRGLWVLTGRGKKTLHNAAPMTKLRVFSTKQGTMWWATAESMLGIVEDESVQLIFTSPPYPLVKQRPYSAPGADEWLAWFVSLCDAWKSKLTLDGSLVLNLGDCWTREKPALNPYQHHLVAELTQNLDYSLAQTFYWLNPTKIPSSHWVTIEKCRAVPNVEPVHWFGKCPTPKSRAERLLAPHSDRHKRLLAKGGERRAPRPSTHGDAKLGFHLQTAGTLPRTLLSIPNSASEMSERRYLSACKREGLAVNPARFPTRLPEHFIRLCTDEAETVWDPFSGSGTTARAAESLGRHWIGNDIALEYAIGSAARFSDPQFL